MKKLLFSLFLPVASLGQEPVKSDVDVLTENYTRAVERATKTITNTYQEELKKLLKKYSEKGDIKNVEKITDILKQYEKPVVMLETDVIIGKWKSPYNTVWVFSEDGLGDKINGDNKTKFIWSKDNEIYTVLGKDSNESESKKWFFKIKNEELFYGQSVNDINIKMIKL